MAIKGSFKKFIGIEDNENFDDFTDEELEEAKQTIIDEEEEEKEKERFRRQSFFNKPEPQPAPQPNADLIRTLTGQQTVIMIEPKSFDECPKLVDSLKGRRAVIINLEKVETETARKVFDFLSGATYALNGTAQKITNNIFIFAPENVNISQPEERSMDFGTQNSTMWKR